jgi:hypothetical protein
LSVREADAIGLGSYNSDSHYIQQLAARDGGMAAAMAVRGGLAVQDVAGRK